MLVVLLQVESVKAQLDAVLLDIGADVVKTGMLPSAEVRCFDIVLKGCIEGLYENIEGVV
jgi:hydroxymethylpyrimidine/phosphomethylpyrimidine kinase